MISHRLFTLLMRVLAAGVVLTIILAGAVLVRLYVEPVDLTFLTPKIEKFLKTGTEGVTFRLRDPKLRWQGPGHSLEMFAHDLEVKTAQETGFTADIPHFYLSFRFRNLLKGEFLPSVLTLEEPKIRYKSFQHKEDKDSETNSREKLVSFLTSLLQTSDQTKILKRLRFIKADLSLDFGKETGLWHIPDLTFALNRKQGFIDGLCDLNFREDQKLAFSFSFSSQEKIWKLDLDIDSISIPFWAKKICFIDFFPQGFEASKFLLSGQMQVSFSEKYALKKANFNFSSRKGILVLKDYLPSPQPFQDLTIEGSLTPDEGLTSMVELQIRKARLKVSSRLQPEGEKKISWYPFYPFSTHYALTIEANLQDFLIEHMEGAWPKESAKPAREWLVKNLRQGIVPKATFHLGGALKDILSVDTEKNGQADPEGQSNPDTRLGKATTSLITFPSFHPRFTLESIKGDIFLEKGTLRYVDTMPEITDISAHASYDQNHFSIQVSQAKTQSLTLQKAHVHISDFQTDKQEIKIKSLANGPLKGALIIINAEPLSVLEKTSLNPAKVEGEIQAEVALSFPIDDRFPEEAIRFSAQARIEKALLPRPLAFLPVSLSDSALLVAVNNDQLSLSGQALLNHVPAKLSWNRSLQKKSHKEEIKVDLSATPSLIKSLGVDVSPYLKGVLPTHVVYEQSLPGKSALKVKTDLSPAHITFGPWQKEARKKGNLSSTCFFQNGHLTRVGSLKVTAPDLSLDLEADFQKNLVPVNVNLKSFKWKETVLKGELSPGKNVDYKVWLEGPMLDLAPHLEALKEETSTDFDLNKSIDLRLRVAKVMLSHRQSFFQNSLSLRFMKNRVHSAAYKGFLDSNNQKEFYIDVLPRSNNGRRLRLKCQDAGYMLKALNFFGDVTEGKLKLTANQADDAPDAPWEGKLEIHSFWLEKAPIISRLLSLAFPTGLVSAFSGKGLPFDRLKIKFKKKKSTLSLYRGRAYSPSFGFSLNGSIKDGLSVLNLQGTIYPAYFFNTFLSRIPILGQVLTGGKHEGIWGVSYTITGANHSPKIQVNPLTVFAPGIFRKIFLPANDEEFDFDNDDDSDDESEEPVFN